MSRHLISRGWDVGHYPTGRVYAAATGDLRQPDDPAVSPEERSVWTRWNKFAEGKFKEVWDGIVEARK